MNAATAQRTAVAIVGDAAEATIQPAAAAAVATAAFARTKPKIAAPLRRREARPSIAASMTAAANQPIPTARTPTSGSSENAIANHAAVCATSDRSGVLASPTAHRYPTV